MILKMFVIYDSKSCTYTAPHVRKEEGEAIRDFKVLANDQNSQIGKFPEDFTLFSVGSFRMDDASFLIFDSKNSLGCALDYVVK